MRKSSNTLRVVSGTFEGWGVEVSALLYPGPWRHSGVSYLEVTELVVLHQVPVQ